MVRTDNINMYTCIFLYIYCNKKTKTWQCPNEKGYSTGKNDLIVSIIGLWKMVLRGLKNKSLVMSAKKECNLFDRLIDSIMIDYEIIFFLNGMRLISCWY